MRECVAGQTYTFRIAVLDTSITDHAVALVAPAISADDFLISINGGSWDMLDNTPTVEPAGSEIIKITISASETTAAGVGGSILLRVADASDDGGWYGGLLEIPVRAAALSELTATQVQASSAAALTTYDPPTKAELDSATTPLATAVALAAVAGYIDTEVAAIKAKTDALPSDPADASDVAAAITTAQNAITTALTATNTVQAIAQAVLKQSVTTVEDSADTLSLAAMILGMFKSSAPSSTWTIYKTDGVTVFAVRALTADSSALPVTGVS